MVVESGFDEGVLEPEVEDGVGGVGWVWGELGVAVVDVAYIFVEDGHVPGCRAGDWAGVVEEHPGDFVWVVWVVLAWFEACGELWEEWLGGVLLCGGLVISCALECCGGRLCCAEGEGGVGNEGGGEEGGFGVEIGHVSIIEILGFGARRICKGCEN